MLGETPGSSGGGYKPAFQAQGGGDNSDPFAGSVMGGSSGGFLDDSGYQGGSSSGGFLDDSGYQGGGSGGFYGGQSDDNNQDYDGFFSS